MTPLTLLNSNPATTSTSTTWYQFRTSWRSSRSAPTEPWSTRWTSSSKTSPGCHKTSEPFSRPNSPTLNCKKPSTATPQPHPNPPTHFTWYSTCRVKYSCTCKMTHQKGWFSMFSRVSHRSQSSLNYLIRRTFTRWMILWRCRWWVWWRWLTCRCLKLMYWTRLMLSRGKDPVWVY